MATPSGTDGPRYGVLAVPPLSGPGYMISCQSINLFYTQTTKVTRENAAVKLRTTGTSNLQNRTYM